MLTGKDGRTPVKLMWMGPGGRTPIRCRGPNASEATLRFTRRWLNVLSMEGPFSRSQAGSMVGGSRLNSWGRSRVNPVPRAGDVSF